MTDNEAIATIQTRINEMLENEEVKSKMVEMHRQGKTKEEIREALTAVAIGTLCGA